MRRWVICLLLSVAAAGVLAACEREKAAAPEPIRPIRGFVVTETATGHVRRFAGRIEARDASALSFQVGGNVREVRVNQGDRVRAGQVLATLDEAPYRLKVQAAEADLGRANADLAQARADYDRSNRLIAQRAVSQAQFEASRRNFQAAQSQVSFASAQVDLARRDLGNTTLAAPFPGSIAARLVDPFVEIRAGQTVFQLDAAGDKQASIGVPESTIGDIRLGMAASVTLPQSAEPISARVIEIGSSAEAGNVFPIKLGLIDPPASVRPGMTAEVALTVESAGAEGALVPLSAIAPGDRADEGFVFVYDQGASTVRRVAVTRSAIAGNMIGVSGLSVGDIVASAGVNFLIDGQKVRLAAPAGGASGG